MMQDVRSSLAGVSTGKSNGNVCGNACGDGMVKCAMCDSFAGDYLQKPKTAPCSRCRAGVPLCERCVEGSCGQSTRREACCFACGQLVCSRTSCSLRCADEECEELYCSLCEGQLPVCSSCFMLHCEGTSDPDTDCLLACEGTPGCEEVICRLCHEARCTCETCHAAVCERCRKECAKCWTVSCPGCHQLTVIPSFCEGCGADRCLTCLVQMRPCDTCGSPVGLQRLREAMVKLTGFIEEWASFRLGKEGKSANPQWTQSLEARAEVASRWKAFITQNDAPSPTADETAATTAAAAAVVEAENQAVYAAGPGSTGAGQSSAAAGFVGDAAAERDQGYANSDRHSDESGETAAAIHGGSRGVSWRTEPSTSPSMRAAPSAGSIGSDDGGGLEVLPIISAEAERAAEGVHVDERGRASVDTVRRFVALTAGAPPRQPTNIEEIKLFFLGWVKPDVIDVFYDSTGDIPQTVKLCEETAGIGEAPPVAPPDLEKEPPPDATNLATGLAGHPAVATVVPPPGFADASAEASKTTVAEHSELEGDPVAEAGSGLVSRTTGDAAPQPCDAVQLTDAAAGTDEVDMNLRAGAGEVTQNTAASTAATAATTIATAITTADDNSATKTAGVRDLGGPMKWKREVESESNAGVAAVTVGTGEVALATDAGVKGPREAQVAVAAQPEAEAAEHEAGRARAETDQEETEAAQADGQGKSVEGRLEGEERPFGEEEKVEEEAASYIAAAAMGGGGGGFVPELTLEEKMKTAMMRNNLFAVRAVLNEASDYPGMQKLKKQCKRWINKREGQLKAEEAERKKQGPLRAATAGAGASAARPVGVTRAFVEMYCPPNIASQLIGKGGANIKRIMKESEAKIVLKEFDSGNRDVVITGTPRNVETATQMVEYFFRLKGCDPSRLPPPNALTAGAGSSRPRAPEPTKGTGAMAVRWVPGSAPQQYQAQPAWKLATAGGGGRGGGDGSRGVAGVWSGGRGGGGGANRVGGSFEGRDEGGVGGRDVGVDVGMSVGSGVVNDGPWGGELLNLLKIAGCERHFERFRKDQLDGESLLLMGPKDFEKMGVSEGEVRRILNALNSNEDSDSDGLDPDHPMTCKICMDAIVEIMFLPCCHQSTCYRCGGDYEGKLCPICRVTVETVQKIIR